MTKKPMIPVSAVVAIFPGVDERSDEEKKTGLTDVQATELFAELKLLRAEATRIIQPLEDAIDAVLEPLHTRILAIEEQFKLHALLRQESIETPHGLCVYISGYYRTSYPRKEVDKFADEHPDIADDLQKLKKESWIKEKVSIKMK